MKRRYGALISLALLAIVAIALVSGIVVSPFARADPVGRVIPVGAHPTSIVVDSATGRAFVLNEAGNSVSVIDTAGGTSIATIPVGVGPRALMVDARRSRVFVLSNAEQTVIDGRYVSYMSPNRPGQVNALDASTGQKIWTRDVGMAPDDMALDAQGARVFVRDLSPDLRSLFSLRFVRPGVDTIDATSGRILRRSNVDRLPTASWGPAAGGWTAHGAVLSAGGAALDDATARPLTLFSPLAGAVDEAASRVALIDRNTSNVRLLDAHDGAIVADTASIGSHPAALALDRRAGRVLVVDGGIPGHVGVFATRDGRLLRVVAVGADPRAVAVDERTGRAFVANRLSKTVSVLDTRTGRPVRTVRVRWDPIAVVVDERTGHALVLSAGGGSVPTPAPDRWAWLPGPIRARLPFLPRPAVPAPSARGSVTIVDASF